MKTVMHLVSDSKMGGTRRGIETMISSSIKDLFIFKVSYENKVLFNNPDVIIWHDPVGTKSLPQLLFLRLRYPRARIIIHEHHYSIFFEVFNPPPNPTRFHLVARLCFSLVDAVVANSEANALWMTNNKLVPESKITVIPSYNDCTEKLQSLVSKIPSKPLTFSFYGRTSHQKGIETLLEAITLVNTGDKFVIQITDEEFLVQNKKLFNNLKDKNVEIVRKINVIDFLNQCDVVVIPSRWESFGQVCLEAKAASKLVIASHVDGLVEQIIPFNCGFTVPPNDPQSLATVITQVSNMTLDQLSSYGFRGRESTRDSLKHYTRSWISLLFSLTR